MSLPSQKRKTTASMDTVQEVANPTKKIKIDFQDVIHITVGSRRLGQQTKSFTIPKNLIADRSAYFADMIESAGGHTNQHELPSEQSDIFAIYVQLLFTGCVTIVADERSICPQDQWQYVLQLYIMTRDFKDEVSEKLVVEDVKRRLRDWAYVPLDAAEFAFNETDPDSEVSQLLLDHIAGQYERDEMHKSSFLEAFVEEMKVREARKGVGE